MQPDPLFALNPMEFRTHIFHFPADYDGPVIATLFEAPRPTIDNGRAVLYVHGYIDYFFQEHLAEHFVARGYRFMPSSCANTDDRGSKDSIQTSHAPCTSTTPT